MQRLFVLCIVLGSIFLLPKGSPLLDDVALSDDPAPEVDPVVFVGDSITMGAWASAEDKMFVWRVWHDLEARGVKGPAENIWTLEPYTDLEAAQRAAVRHRKLIILEVGVHWAPVFDATGFRKVYGSMLGCLEGSGATVVVGTIPWLGWAPGTPTYAKMNDFSQIIREEAAKRDIAVADLWAETDRRYDALSRPGQPCFSAPGCEGDNYHPGDVGHELIAEAYLRALDVALSDPPRHEYEFRCNFDQYFRILPKGSPVPTARP